MVVIRSQGQLTVWVSKIAQNLLRNSQNSKRKKSPNFLTPEMYRMDLWGFELRFRSIMTRDLATTPRNWICWKMCIICNHSTSYWHGHTPYVYNIEIWYTKSSDFGSKRSVYRFSERFRRQKSVLNPFYAHFDSERSKMPSEIFKISIL